MFLKKVQKIKNESVSRYLELAVFWKFVFLKFDNSISKKKKKKWQPDKLPHYLAVHFLFNALNLCMLTEYAAHK